VTEGDFAILGMEAGAAVVIRPFPDTIDVVICALGDDLREPQGKLSVIYREGEASTLAFFDLSAGEARLTHSVPLPGEASCPRTSSGGESFILALGETDDDFTLAVADWSDPESLVPIVTPSLPFRPVVFQAH
jgi:hypothetical protein